MIFIQDISNYSLKRGYPSDDDITGKIETLPGYTAYYETEVYSFLNPRFYVLFYHNHNTMPKKIFNRNRTGINVHLFSIARKGINCLK